MVNLLYVALKTHLAIPEWVGVYDLDYDGLRNWRVSSEGVTYHEKPTDGTNYTSLKGAYGYLHSEMWIRLSEQQAFDFWPALKLAINTARGMPTPESPVLPANLRTTSFHPEAW